MKEYDNAAYRYYSGLDLKSLPLMSWDIYGLYFDILCKNYDDVTTLLRLSEDNNWSYTSKFNEALLQKEQVILVTDTQLNIVHATHNIVHMNGYSPHEILGKRPKVFQGEGTSKETTGQIRKAIENRIPFEAVILNYRKDGSTYNCWLRGEPIFDTSGVLVNFIAYEKEVA
ncbi:PAS domain-containing protein [Pricia sp.]|uniref:PAS domain-containing protein n=1 Tax=Pricia sp. TaxID=2268138 RepID=UPI003593DD87